MEIELGYSPAVGRKRDGEMQQFRVLLRLLEPIRGLRVFALGFHYSQREAWRNLKRVVGPKLVLAPGTAATEDYPARSYRILGMDLVLQPSSVLQAGQDELATCR